MFVSSSERFREYTDWRVSIFDLAKEEIDVSGYDEYHKRLYGFLSEQLNFVWIKSKDLAYHELPVGITQEKAETIELKYRLAEEIKTADPECGGRALALFRNEMERRPDVMLGGSDLSGELTDMFRILYILEQEQRNEPEKCMLRLTNRLDQLVIHYRLITSILKKQKEAAASDEEIAYLRDANISDAMKNQILSILK